jgi:outer membrane lipoprotein-sorting protein
MMKTRLIIFFIISYFYVSAAFSQEIENISVEFTRMLKKETSEEVIKGTFYYQKNKRIIFKITEPIGQWIVLEGNAMLIYYPNDDKAFRYSGKNPVSMPFFQTFVTLSSEDWGLSKLGYTIGGSESRGDTVWVHWKPPKNGESPSGEFVTALKEDRIVLTELKDAKGKTLIQTTYGDHVNFYSQSFPLRIKSFLFSNNGFSMESLTYSSPVFNKPLPGEILNFTLPRNIKIEDVKW